LEIEIDDEALLRQFKSDMNAMNGSEGAGLELDHLDRLFQVFRANAEATVRYEPQPYEGRITYFRAADRISEYPVDPIDEWRNLAADGVELHVAPGNHYTMLKEPAVLVLADWLKVCLKLTRRVEAAKR
jgi:thioesterase domain-containing protein